MSSSASSTFADASFTVSQQVALAVVPVVTGFFSLVGASCIVYVILLDPKRNQNLSKTYHRVLLGLTVTDIFGSIRACTSAFAMPVGAWWMASGNQATCELQGSLAQIAIGAALYSSCLAIYFWMTIRNFNKRTIARRVEPFMHGISILFPVFSMVYGLINHLYNPVELGVGCWVSSYPTGCADDPDAECTRGQDAKVLIWVFAGIPVGLSLLIVAVSMVSIFFNVRSTIRRMEQRYSVVATQNQSRSSEFRIRQTALQAALYIGAFILTYLWTSVLRLMENDGKVSSGYFSVALLSAFFYPLQGFFNFFIYIRPRYVELSRQHPSETKVDVLGRIFHREPTSGRKKAANSGGTAGTAEEPSSLNLASPSSLALSSGRRMSSWFLGRGSLPRRSQLQGAGNERNHAAERCLEDVHVDDTKQDGEVSESVVRERNDSESEIGCRPVRVPPDGTPCPPPAINLDEIDSRQSQTDPMLEDSAAAMLSQHESSTGERDLDLEIGDA